MASNIRDYEQYVDDDIKAVAEGEGTEAERLKKLQAMDAEETRKLGAAREYTPGVSIDSTKAQEAVDLVNQMRNDAINRAIAAVTPQTPSDPVATPSAPTQTPTPAPAAPTLENGGTVVKNGMGETMFGKYKRVVDQKSGKETWINTETGQEEVPQSMRFQQMSDTTRRVMDEQRRGAQERRVRSMQRRVDAGNAFGAALSTLTGEVARGEDGSIFGKDGKPIDERIRVSADGKHIYLMGKAEPGVLRDVNESRRKNGSASDYKAVIAYRELDRNGNPLKNEDGTERSPMIAVTDQPGGDPNVKRRFRIMSSGDVANKMLDAMKSLGRGDEDAKNEIITNVFGGIDPLGWGKTLKQKPNDGKLTFEQRVALEEKKNEGLLAVEKARLNRSNAPKSKSDFITDMLVKGAFAKRSATTADVENGIASYEGMSVDLTPDERLKLIGDYYDKIYRNQDPALGGGNGGGSPIVVSPFDPLHPDNPVVNPPVAPAAGGDAAHAQTAAPSPSATATPPAEGQGELDFGGAEPEAAPVETQTTTQTVTSDEDEERKRRQAANPKSNSWKNSKLFK